MPRPPRARQDEDEPELRQPGAVALERLSGLALLETGREAFRWPERWATLDMSWSPGSSMPWHVPPSIWLRLGQAGSYVASASAAPLPVRLAVAGVVLAFATAVRLAIAPALHDGLPYATYYLAVEIAAVLGGLVPGLAVTFASAFLAHILFSSAVDAGLLLFLASCSIFCAIAEALQRARLALMAKLAAQEADSAHKRLQATMDMAQDAILTIDPQGRIRSINRAGVEMFGSSAHQIVGTQFGMLLEEGAAPDAAQPPASLAETREVLGKRKNGKSFPAELTLSGRRLEHERLNVAVIRDLTERRRFEQKVGALHRSRLHALGDMAAGLAHEINQPLAAVVTYLKVARRILEKAPAGAHSDALEIVEKASAQALRAGRIVSSLRDLMRRGEPDKTLLGLHELIRDAIQSIRAEGGQDNIAISLALRAQWDGVMADRAQIGQVLTHLLRNAAEAMQSAPRRELVVATSNPDETTIRVDVIDTGCGLPDSSHDGCFEPFTTTKSDGVGVGLSNSRSIIEEHYGRIWATPNAEGGAVFSFTLPLQYPDVAS